MVIDNFIFWKLALWDITIVGNYHFGILPFWDLHFG